MKKSIDTGRRMDAGYGGSTSRYWRDQWKEKKLALRSTQDTVSPGYWENRDTVTDLYIPSRAHESWRSKVNMQMEAMQIPDGARVLDIGGGTGTLAVPLSLNGCDVTVVEPSATMRKQLVSNLGSSGAASVNIVPSWWEDVSISDLGNPFDAVIASYSLSMLDIDAAIMKMQSFCRGTVHLFWFMTPPSWAWVSRDLWPLLHGRAYPGEPLADCLWQALYEMGIYAGITSERKIPRRYENIDDAVSEYARRLNCSTPRHIAILSEYFSQVLSPDGPGLVLGKPSLGAHIWWKTAKGN